jgi:hypothetical protein
MSRPILVVLVLLLAAISPALQSSLQAAESASDAQALLRLADGGSDLSKLHRVEFFLEFAEAEAAESAVLKLGELAFAASSNQDDSTGHWVVRAVKAMYPIESDLRGLRDKLDVIAAEGNGRYQGWQARVLERN